MKLRNSLRLAALGLFASAALAASALDAFSNIAGPYLPNGYLVDPTQSIGFQFVPTLSGTVSGFTVAMNADNGSASAAYALDLYADDGADRLGALLGTYAGLSNGENFTTATGFSVVPALGAPVGIASGVKYWLVASSANSLIWNDAGGAAAQRTYYTDSGAPRYDNLSAGAFSVQVVPEPASLAALGLGVAAFARRRRARA